MLFPSPSLPLIVLYTRQSLTVKKVGAFISAEDLLLYFCVLGGILHSC